LFRQIRDNLKQTITQWKEKHSRFQPKLAIVQVGTRDDSTLYVKQKKKAAEEVTIQSTNISYY
jgi:methylenetetrahydrofolate dehydrogenase (NADP+)/methenyltetrahydrofolate cyclohydrolase/formyltetrahydrofolate synthetase